MSHSLLSIEKVASAYCEGRTDVAMRQQALVLAQCDVLILRLRANGVALLKFIEGRAPFARIAPENFPGGDDSSWFAPTVEDRLPNLDHVAAQFGMLPPGGLNCPSALDSALYHLDVLSRMEDAIHLRRRRALRRFTAIRRATIGKKDKKC